MFIIIGVPSCSYPCLPPQEPRGRYEVSVPLSEVANGTLFTCTAVQVRQPVTYFHGTITLIWGGRAQRRFHQGRVTFGRGFKESAVG